MILCHCSDLRVMEHLRSDKGENILGPDPSPSNLNKQQLLSDLVNKVILWEPQSLRVKTGSNFGTEVSKGDPQNVSED